MHHRNDNSTSMIRPLPVQEGPPIIRIPERMPGNRTVYATNTPSDWRVALLAGLFLVLFAGLFGYIVFLWSADTPMAIIAALGAFAVTGYQVLIVVNGDKAAQWEIREGEGTERQRIITTQEMHERQMQHEYRMRELTHIETMASIEASATTVAMQQELAWLTDQVTAARQVTAPAQTFVAPAPRPALVAAQKWTMSMYGTDGQLDADRVHTAGHLRVALPWNGEWRGEEWRDEARRYLLDNGILVEVSGAGGGVRGYRMACPTVGRAMQRLRNVM